jgi:hypothetical protein
VWLIRFPALTPDVRRELPAGVANWLLPAALAFDKIRSEK